jgi:hypothetical protein
VKWRNAKYNAKRNASQHKAAAKKTGGGPPPTPLDDSSAQIMDICNNDGELCSPFDSESSKTRRSVPQILNSQIKRHILIGNLAL